MTVTPCFAYLDFFRFYAESEFLRRDWGKETPVIIVSAHADRGLVLDFSGNFPAGTVLCKGMFLKDVRVKCQILTLDDDYIRSISNEVRRFLEQFTPLTEYVPAGGFYLDLSGTKRLFGRPIDTVRNSLSHFRTAYRFHCRAGLGKNRPVAYAAALSAGLWDAYQIWPGAERVFFASLSVDRIPGLSPKTREAFHKDYTIDTLGDLSVFSETDLICMFGDDGRVLFQYARYDGEDVFTTADARRLGKASSDAFTVKTLLSGGPNDDERLRRRFFELVLDGCVLLRSREQAASCFFLNILYQDGRRFHKNGRFQAPVFLEKTAYAELLPHFNTALARRVAVKSAELRFGQISAAALQSSFFDSPERELMLSHCLDTVRQRFGKTALYYGRSFF